MATLSHDVLESIAIHELPVQLLKHPVVVCKQDLANVQHLGLQFSTVLIIRWGFLQRRRHDGRASTEGSGSIGGGTREGLQGTESVHGLAKGHGNEL